jgi:hypothetical protein
MREDIWGEALVGGGGDHHIYPAMLYDPEHGGLVTVEDLLKVIGGVVPFLP